MKLLKILSTTFAAVVFSVSSYASNITVGGVTWDPDYDNVPFGQDLAMGIDFVQWFVAAADASSLDFNDAISPLAVANGDFLRGYGTVDSLNNPAGVTCAGCELSFEFALEADGAGGFLNNGFFKFYVDYTVDSLPTTSDFVGQPWLELSVDSVQFSGTAGAGSYLSGNLTALASVAGGLAAGNFDTNSILGSDVFYSASANFDPGQVVSDLASGQFTGDTIPEPTTIAILGLGLLGLASTRRKAK